MNKVLFSLGILALALLAISGVALAWSAVGSALSDSAYPTCNFLSGKCSGDKTALTILGVGVAGIAVMLSHALYRRKR